MKPVKITYEATPLTKKTKLEKKFAQFPLIEGISVGATAGRDISKCLAQLNSTS